MNDKVEFKDASKMWGKTTDETHEMMVKEMKDSRDPDGRHRPGR